jgi:3-hydroxyacyl-[acyl-carrier-protein] dehydratase
MSQGIPGPASPITGPFRVVDLRPDGLTAIYVVDPDEPILRGHFPGFHIFPGVCLIECAHRAALIALSGNVELAAVERVRFHAPVFPGDEVTVRLTVAGQTCKAALTVRHAADGRSQDAAAVRLRYREGVRR